MLETVWYVCGPTTAEGLRDYMAELLSPNDLLLVVQCDCAAWTHLLVDERQFKMAFEAQLLAAA